MSVIRNSSERPVFFASSAALVRAEARGIDLQTQRHEEARAAVARGLAIILQSVCVELA